MALPVFGVTDDVPYRSRLRRYTNEFTSPHTGMPSNRWTCRLSNVTISASCSNTDVPYSVVS